VRKEKVVRKEELPLRKPISPVEDADPKQPGLACHVLGVASSSLVGPASFPPPYLAFPSMVEGIFVGVPPFFVNFQIESKKHFIFLSKKIR